MLSAVLTETIHLPDKIILGLINTINDAIPKKKSYILIRIV